MDGTASAGAGATERVLVTLPTPLASELALAAPSERRRVGVPASGGRFEPVHDLLRGIWRLAFEGAADEDPLDRLGHVQPGAAQRGVQRHDAMGN